MKERMTGLVTIDSIGGTRMKQKDLIRSLEYRLVFKSINKE